MPDPADIAGPTIEPAPEREKVPTTFAGFLAMAAADCVDGSTTVRPKCGNCGTNDAADEHGCPYAEEIHDDFTTMCTCCDDCRHDCLMEI